MTEELLLQQITYYRAVRPPTLKQYLVRRAVKEASAEVIGTEGTEMHNGRLVPSSARVFYDKLSGKTAEELAKEHPEWLEDYRERYPG